MLLLKVVFSELFILPNSHLFPDLELIMSREVIQNIKPPFLIKDTDVLVVVKMSCEGTTLYVTQYHDFTMLIDYLFL